MVTEALVPVIDYTSRDYESLRADLIRLIRARVPFWTADNPSDFGVALVEAFAYGIDGLHYYLDRVANEAYLSTAVQRESIYSIANMFNYLPRRPEPSQVYLEFRNSTQSEVTLPAGMRVQASISGQSGTALRNFETQEEVILAAGTAVEASKVTDILALEGRTYTDESIGVSNGFINQRFFLPRTSVLDNTVTITTQLGGSEVEWTEISSLLDAYPTDRMFETIQQTDGSTVVRFGNGLNGDIPGLHSVVRASYRVGGGTGGNVPANTITTIIEPVVYGVSVTNPDPATGGKNAESLDSIRINAARSYRSRDRAVTLADYVSVTESGLSADVSAAKAVGNNGSSVTVYVAPVDDGTKRPILTENLDNKVTTYLETRAMAGVTIQVFGAAFTEIYLVIAAHCQDSARSSDVETAIRNRLDYYFRYQNLDFDQTVTAQDLYAQFLDIDGLAYADITGIGTSADPTSVATIVMNDLAVNAIPYFSSDETLTLTMSGGISS